MVRYLQQIISDGQAGFSAGYQLAAENPKLARSHLKSVFLRLLHFKTS